MTESLSAATEAALREVSVASLTALVAERGYASTFICGLRATRPDLRLVGRALTLRYVPNRRDAHEAMAWKDAAANPQRAAVERVGPGQVLVIDARGRADAAVLGDVLAARAAAGGAAGIVTDGALRDTPAFAALDLPVYHRASHGGVASSVHLPLEQDVPIGCGEVLVLPGDVLVGDAEGVVVIPFALVDEVAQAALALEEEDAFGLEHAHAGRPLTGVFPPDEAHQGDFEAWRARRRGAS